MKILLLLLLLSTQALATKGILIHTETYPGARKIITNWQGAVDISARAWAPNGRSSRYIDTVGVGEFDWEIKNWNSKPIRCIVTKRVCMDNTEECINQTDTYDLAKRASVHKKEQLVHVVRYDQMGTKWTYAEISFQGCGSSKNTSWQRGKIEVSR